jgi:hypothetical protein
VYIPRWLIEKSLNGHCQCGLREEGIFVRACPLHVARKRDSARSNALINDQMLHDEGNGVIDITDLQK